MELLLNTFQELPANQHSEWIRPNFSNFSIHSKYSHIHKSEQGSRITEETVLALKDIFEIFESQNGFIRNVTALFGFVNVQVYHCVILSKASTLTSINPNRVVASGR